MEIKTLISKKPLVYEGIFRLDEMYNLIRRFIDERGYFNIEDRNEEKILPNGKDIFIVLKPFGKVSDYAKRELVLDIQAHEVNDKVVEVQGHKQKYQYGKIQILFTANLITDWRERWEGTGFYFLLRTLTDRFIRRDVSREVEDILTKDCLDLEGELKSYFNMVRFKMGKPTDKTLQMPEEPKEQPEEEPKEILAINSVVRYEDQILLLKGPRRITECGEDDWSCLECPADNVSLVKQRALADLQEETGISVSSVEHFTEREKIEITDKETGKTVTIYPTIIDLKEKPEVKLGAGRTEFKWVPREELSRYDVSESFDQVLKGTLENKP